MLFQRVCQGGTGLEQGMQAQAGDATSAAGLPQAVKVGGAATKGEGENEANVLSRPKPAMPHVEK